MPKKKSLFDGESYKGYKVSVKLVREGLGKHEPAKITNPQDIYGFMKGIGHSDRERFYSILLNSRNEIINCEEVSCGSVTSALVHPREVFKSALLCSSSSVILVHNHPSGDPEPSFEDKILTERLYRCGELLGIDVLDSVIIGNESYFSFMEKGMMDTYKGRR